eukprot:SAG22_NODE_4263_length_1324_cov_2.265306_1_plen_245_part_10
MGDVHELVVQTIADKFTDSLCAAAPAPLPPLCLPNHHRRCRPLRSPPPPHYKRKPGPDLTAAAVCGVRLDKLDEETRAAAVDFMAQDRKTLERAIEKRALSVENLKLATESGNKARAQRIEVGLATADHIIAELQAKLDGGLEAYGWVPTEKAVAAARETARLRKEKKALQAHRVAMAELRKVPKKKRKAAAAPSGAAEAGSTAAAAPVDKSIVFEAAEPAEARLDKLFAKAMELEHPGIDQEGV